MTGNSNLAGFQNFLAAGGLPELGPGPRKEVLPHDQLEAPLEKMLSEAGLSSTASDLVRALILLWHDRLDAAHSLAQGIEDADGSFVHGIVHRREPDYSNARYWFRRVDGHATFPRIADEVARLVESAHGGKLPKELISKGEWNPFAFIDLCENAARKPPSADHVKLLREIQGIEFEVLLEYFLTAGV